MQNSNWFQQYFRGIILFLSAGLIWSISLVSEQAYLLKTVHAPQGNFSWQTNTDSLTQRNILREWKLSGEKIRVYKSDTSYVKHDTGLIIAKRQNNRDYVMIFFYTLLLAVLLYRINNWRVAAGKPLLSLNERRIWITSALLGGLMDVLEDWNTGIALKYYESQQVASTTIAFFALLKWIFLAAAVLRLIIEIIRLQKFKPALRLLSSWLTAFVKLAWRYRTVFLVLLLLFAVLYASDQGQDLLLTINTSRFASILFLAITSLLALLCWYLPKVIENAATFSFGDFFRKSADFTVNIHGKRPKSKVDFGRLLGASAFLIPGTGILQTMNNYHIEHVLSTIPPLILFLMIILLYRTVLKNNWLEKWYKVPNTSNLQQNRFWWTISVITIIIIGLGIVSYNRQPFFLFFLFIDLLLLSFLFLLFTSLRTCITTLNKVPVALFIMLPGLAVFLFFIACNFTAFLNPITDGERFYTVPIVFCGIAAHLFFFSFLLFTGKKTGVQIISLLLLTALFFSATKVSDYHNAAILTQKEYRNDDSLETYTHKWLAGRNTEITQYLKEHPGKDYPVFFTNTYGGGIKAAVWTTMVVGTLDSLMLTREKQTRDFTHYIFSWSGASGGTIGLSLLSGTRYQDAVNQQPNRLFYPDNSIHKVYQKDYLTADIVALIGRDLVAGSLGLSPWPDRSRLMEQDWERNNKGRIAMGVSFGKIWRNSKADIPLLFSNTYDIDAGQKGITAPVILSSRDFPSIISLRQKLCPNEDLRLSTGSFMSARFPFVSPTGKLKGKYHFTDGGTYDNSGAETTMQVYTVFERVRAAMALKDKTFEHIRPHFLAINSTVETGDSLARVKNLYEPIAPLLGVINLGNGIARKSLDLQFAFAKDKCFDAYFVQPIIIKGKNNCWPVLPLGWQISDDALLTMKMGAVKTRADIEKILTVFRPEHEPDNNLRNGKQTRAN